MKNKEEVLKAMFEEMPYQMIGKEQLLPYIKEAMDVYAKRQLLAYHEHLDSLNDPTIYNVPRYMLDDFIEKNKGQP